MDQHMSDESMNYNVSPDPALRRMSEKKVAEEKFDVFLYYNPEDESRVRKIGQELMSRGISPWLDVWEIRPGTPWQREKDRQMRRARSAAVFVGASGMALWEQLEVDALLRKCVERKCPVIPVLLEDAPNELELSLVLEGMRQVDFRILKQKRDLAPDEDPLNLLIWGITGKPAKQRCVLIASLGDSPVVVSTMYDLLTQRKNLMIDQVIVLHPEGKDIESGYALVKKALAGKCNSLRREILPFKDASSWRDACIFLKELYVLLDTCRARGDMVYLSLAGGRKSMAAMMAWIAPFFPCVEHLYHVIDPDEKHFLSIDQLERDLTPSQRELAMHPDPDVLESLHLVHIPSRPEQQIDQGLIDRLLSASEEDLERMQYEDAEKAGEAERANILRVIAEPGKALEEAWVTKAVIEQFHVLRQQNSEVARHVRDFLDRMQSTSELHNLQPDSLDYTPPKSTKRTRVELHIFTIPGTPVRVVFYTLPKDIYTDWDKEVEQVIICELDTSEESQQKSLQEIATSPDFSIEKASRLEKLPRVPPSGLIDSVLIVPLGTFPMVATQLYTLLKRQESRNIRKIVLVYPGQSAAIVNSAELVESALQEEANISCILAPVQGQKDIDSQKACRDYQATLEKEIKHACDDEYHNCTIDLALSGGRKGMTAMTIFAAQNNHLPYVYHTLITDERLSDKIEKETTVGKLNDMGGEERNNKLFLRDYEDDEADPKFVLFRIPVFPAGKQ
jgi:CRISPR-associated Csx14 family protein